MARPETLLPVVEMWATDTSATPKTVTLDWARAPAETVRAARARRVRFMLFTVFVEMRKPMQYGYGLPWTGPVWD
ncbi:hypothetical protein CTTA_0101 [Comamonas testosteroni]|uniref:Uncharacterized protein n=1 Tax=Comamonas testosteroni TaxID=285 RepID=A0A5A7M679_COMTE|nr:hypothetical protein CTTA_0101 [Comamonas testosteroni]